MLFDKLYTLKQQMTPKWKFKIICILMKGIEINNKWINLFQWKTENHVGGTRHEDFLILF